MNGRPIRHIFHRFQNVPASCERSLKGEILFCKIAHHLGPEVRKMMIRGMFANKDSTFHFGHILLSIKFKFYSLS